MTDRANRTFWEKTAKIYTAFMAKNNDSYLKICKSLETYIDSNKYVLELACGTGQITFLWRQNLVHGKQRTFQRI